MKIDKLTSTAHHHQILGAIERTYRTFSEYVRSYFTYFTPLYNVDSYAKKAKFRLEVTLKRAKQLLNINKINQKNNYDRNIFLKNETGLKLDNQYKGPYKIKKLDLRNNVAVVDKIANNEQTVNKNRLKLCNKSV